MARGVSETTGSTSRVAASMQGTIGSTPSKVNADRASESARPPGRGSLPILRFVRNCDGIRGMAAFNTRKFVAQPLLPRHAGPRGPLGMRPLAINRVRGGRRGAPLEAFSHTEKVIAFCRVLLAAAILAVAVVDPRQPSFSPDIGYVVLSLYLLYSGVLFLIVRGEYVRQDRVGVYSVAIDIIWIAAITLFTERGATPFFLLNIFVILSVSVRWGFAASAPVTVGLSLLYPALIFLAGHLVDREEFAFARAH